MLTFVKRSDCPFKVTDRVRCLFTKEEAVVVDIDYAHVYCMTDHGVWFYRTWSHDLDLVSRKSGGGLVRLTERK